MNTNEIARMLRKMDNSDASQWLMDNYPTKHNNYSDVFNIIPHISWKKKERIKLAKYFFTNLHLASQKPFWAFLKIMPVKEFLDVIDELINSGVKFDYLLIYHLEVISSCLENEGNINYQKIYDFIQKLKKFSNIDK